jgi:CHASE1-domain containing sensor protein
MLNALPVLIVIWVVLSSLFLALLAYNATLSRYEESQLFLDEVNANERQQQDSIVRKIRKTQPFLRVMGALSGILAVVIISIYTWDCWQKLQGQ